MLVKLIQCIHLLIMLFILMTPFFGSEYYLSLHFLVVPFIMLHWVTNQTVCALTELEKLVRGGCASEETIFGKIVDPIYKSESFMGRIIAPFYTFEDWETETLAVWVGLTALWLITLFKLWPTGFAHLQVELDRVLVLFTRPRMPPP
jgi:hypothetical protein